MHHVKSSGGSPLLIASKIPTLFSFLYEIFYNGSLNIVKNCTCINLAKPFWAIFKKSTHVKMKGTCSGVLSSKKV